MKMNFPLMIVIPPALLIGLVLWLTISQIISGTTLIVCWIVAVLGSVAFDTWISAHYTIRRLNDQHQKEGKKHHE